MSDRVYEDNTVEDRITALFVRLLSRIDELDIEVAEAAVKIQTLETQLKNAQVVAARLRDELYAIAHRDDD